MTLTGLITQGLTFFGACCPTSGWDSQKDRSQSTRPFCGPCPTLQKLHLHPFPSSWEVPLCHTWPRVELEHGKSYLIAYSLPLWLPLTWDFVGLLEPGLRGRRGPAFVECDFRWPFSDKAPDSPWSFSQPRPGTSPE